MSAAIPALLLVALGAVVAIVGLSYPLAAPANQSRLLIIPIRSLTIACTVGIGTIQMLGGSALLAAGWS